MIISESNFTLIAKKFSDIIDKANINALPRYISIWPEYRVYAIRTIIGENVSYGIVINGKEITSINVNVEKDGHSVSTLTIDNIVYLLTVHTQQYVKDEVERVVRSIVQTVNDFQFVSSLLPGSLNAHVYTIPTGSGEMRFIDVYQNDKPIYSSLHSSGYEEQLIAALTDTLIFTHQTNGLVISIS